MLEFRILDPAGAYVDTAYPLSDVVVLRQNDVSTADLTFDDDDPRLAKIDDGYRVDVYHDDTRIMGGEWDSITRTNDGVTVKVFDEFEDFRLLGWPNPGSAIGSQSSEYKRYSDNVEGVVKAACADLSTRLSLGWSNASDKNLGSTVRVEARFHPLTDLFLPLLNADRLRWTKALGVVDVTEGELFPQILTPESGVIGDHEWSRKRGKATRVVVGGAGEGAARRLAQYIDSGLEAVWRPREIFADARTSDGVTNMASDGAKALAENAPTVSFSADLAENQWFRFGAYNVGDRVHIQVGSVDVTEVITKVTITETPAQGSVTVPTVGFADDTADSILKRMVTDMTRSVRDLRSR